LPASRRIVFIAASGRRSIGSAAARIALYGAADSSAMPSKYVETDVTSAPGNACAKAVWT
jgi:hypothetical protein